MIGILRASRSNTTYMLQHQSLATVSVMEFNPPGVGGFLSSFSPPPSLPPCSRSCSPKDPVLDDQRKEEEDVYDVARAQRREVRLCSSVVSPPHRRVSTVRQEIKYIRYESMLSEVLGYTSHGNLTNVSNRTCV